MHDSHVDYSSILRARMAFLVVVMYTFRNLGE